MKRCFCAMLILLVAVCMTVAVYADNVTKDRKVYLYAEAVSGTGSFSGIDLPSDAALFEKTEEDKEAESEEEDISLADADDQDVEETEEQREAIVPILSNGKTAKLMNYANKEYFSCPVDSNGESIDITFALDDYKADTENGKIAIGVYAAGFSKREDDRSVVAATLTVSGKKERFSSTLPVYSNTAFIIYIDSEIFGSDFNISNITLRLKNAGDDFSLKSVRVTEPFVTENHDFSYQQKNGILWMMAPDGGIKSETNSLEVYTAESAVSFFVGSCAYSDTPDEDEVVRYVSISAELGNASVIAARADSVPDDTMSLTAQADGDSAVFRILGSGTAGTLISVKNSSGKNVTLGTIGFYATTEKAYPFVRPLVDISYEDEELYVEGRLNSETVKEYKKGYVGLFMVRADGVGEPIQIGKTSISSKYIFEVSLAEYPHALTDCMFYVAVVDSEGNMRTVSDKRFVSSKSVSDTSKTLYGLYGVDPVSVYESGASRVMIDIDITRLADSTSLSGTIMTNGDYVFGVNSDYLREIDKDMTFYMTSDVSVYVRLLCSGTIKSRTSGDDLTYRMSGDETMIRTDNAEGINLYMALSSFLCDRYPNIVSFVLGSGVNSEKYTGSISSEPYKRAETVALAARYIYSAVYDRSEVFVTLEFSNETAEGNIMPQVFGALVAEKMKNIGNIPWAVLSTGTKCEQPKVGDGIMMIQRFNGVPTASFSIYCWEPEERTDDLIESYRELCASSDAQYLRIVFLSEKKLDSPLRRDELNVLKHQMKNDDVIILDMDGVVLSRNEYKAISGSAYLWDFSNAYSKLGWVQGYGIESLATIDEGGLSGESTDRVLRCITEYSDESVAGIMLSRFASPINFASAPLIEFTYSHRSPSPVTVVLVFGNGENRAEFTVPHDIQPDSDGKYRISCDLTEFSKTLKVAYAGIIVYSSGSTVFDLSSVKVMSETLDDSAVAKLIEPPEVKEEKELPMVRLIIASLIMMVVVITSVRMFALLKNKDKKLVNVIKRRRYR